MNAGSIGIIMDDVLKIVGMEGTDIIADVNITLGPGSIRRQDIRGQLLMIEIDDTNNYGGTYDIVAFSLIREMFGLDFPRIGTITYHGTNYIVCKRFADRPIKLDDYWPNTEANREFRFRLGMIIYFCKLVGCALHLSDVRVLDGYPFYWRCTSMGYKNCHTVTEAEFGRILGFHFSKTSHAFTHYMVRALTQHFTSVDFDTDVLRGHLYLKDDIVRFTKGNKVKYPLSRRPREIENLIEQNYSVLLSSYPFNIFKK